MLTSAVIVYRDPRIRSGCNNEIHVSNGYIINSETTYSHVIARPTERASHAIDQLA